MSRLVLLIAVLGSAVAYGLWPSLFACLICALAYNFFFLPPLYTFTIADAGKCRHLGVFMLVAVIASNLTARMRMQAIVARQRAGTTEDLYRFSRKLAGIAAMDDLLWATAYQVAHMLDLHVVLLLPEGESLRSAPAIRRKICSMRTIWRPRAGLSRKASLLAAAPIHCRARGVSFCRCERRAA